MSVKLRTLNNYPEWKTKKGIIEVAKYLETKDDDDPTYPASIKTDKDRNHFLKKFNTGDFQVNKRGNVYNVYYIFS